MYGKIFEALYEGSMVGSGAKTFAVWGYVIAHMRRDETVGAQVDLNPKLLGFILGEKEEDVAAVIEALCSPDPLSRTPDEEGRRLVRLGQYTYRVVNGAKYMDIRSAEERREYFRLAKRKERSIKSVSVPMQIIKKKVNGDPITKADAATMKKKWSVKSSHPTTVEQEYDLDECDNEPENHEGIATIKKQGAK